MNKEIFYNEIFRIYNKIGRINKKIFDDNKEQDLSYTYNCYKYGGIRTICKELGIEYLTYNRPLKQDVLDDIMCVYNKLGSIKIETYLEHGKYSKQAIKTATGGFNLALKELGIKINMHKNVSRQDMIDDFNSFYATHNTTSSTKYRKYGGYSQSTIENEFGSWCDFIEHIGLKTINKKVGYDEIIRKSNELYNEYGFISKDLIDDNCDFSYQALSSYFKNKKELSIAVAGIENIFAYGRSSKEKLIASILEKLLGVCSFKTEYTFKWLKNNNGKNMYVDFYIPSLNLVIEYDGEQHYKYVSKFHKSEDDFIKQKERDNLKNELLLSHNVLIKRIKYDQKINKELLIELMNE